MLAVVALLLLVVSASSLTCTLSLGLTWSSTSREICSALLFHSADVCLVSMLCGLVWCARGVVVWCAQLPHGVVRVTSHQGLVMT